MGPVLPSRVRVCIPASLAPARPLGPSFLFSALPWGAPTSPRLWWQVCSRAPAPTGDQDPFPTPVERASLLLWGLLGAQPGKVRGLLFLFPPPTIEHVRGRTPPAGGRQRGRSGNGSVPSEVVRSPGPVGTQMWPELPTPRDREQSEHGCEHL